MATTITPSTAAKNAALDAIVDLLDAGSSDANADVKIYDSGDVLLCTLEMTNPAFGAAAAGVATAAAITNGTAGATGTASYFTMNDRDNTEVFRGSVGTSGEALNLNTTSIVSGGTVSITAFTLSA